MKRSGSYFYLEKERNRELLSAFNAMYSASSVINSEFYQHLSRIPSRRFWVSEERAAIVLSQMQRGDDLSTMIPTKRQMFQDLFKVFETLKDKHPTLSFSELVCLAVESQAPSFYLTPKSIKIIIYKIRRRWYDKSNRYIKK